jgi:PAS domain-containing protein
MTSPRILNAVRSNGKQFPIEATISQVMADGEKIFTVILRDITRRKQAEEALRASEHRWSTTLRSIGDAVISTDAVGNIEFMNDVAQRLTGWSLPEARGRDLIAVFDII